MPEVEANSTFRVLQDTGPVRLLVRGFMASTKTFPVWFLRVVGMFFVALFIVFTPGNFRAIMSNMRRIRPGISTVTAMAMTVGVYKYCAYYLIDLFYISHDIDRIDEYDTKIIGSDNIARAVDSGKGMVLLTVHMGNWELGGLVLRPYNKIINVVYSPDTMGILEKQRSCIRDADNIREIPLSPDGFSSLKLLRKLEQGEALALQGDRLLFDRGVSVRFLGGRATFPQGPVKLAMLAGALVVPVFIPITGYKSYEIIVEDPIQMDDSQDLKANVEQLAGVIGRYVSRYPTQWYAFERFWDDDEGGPEGEN